MNELKLNYIYEGDCLETLKTLPDNCIDMCVTSPPYYALRDYGTGKWVGGDPNCPHYRTSKKSEHTATGHKRMGELGEAVGDAIYKNVCPLCGAVREDKQIGLEETPEAYISKLADVFDEVKRVLKDDGTLWVNIGDSYNGYKGNAKKDNFDSDFAGHSGHPARKSGYGLEDKSLKPKDLIGIPWMLAFELRKRGWYLRQDIIWCLSGGAYVWVKSQKGVRPMMIKDLIRLNPKTVQLWNGSKWVDVLGYGENNDTSEKIELVLRSGERIGCTGGHKWVLDNGTEVLARDLKTGDVLKSCNLPDENSHTPSFMTMDLLWFLGLYLAEGSLSGDCIQIALNIDEMQWYDRILGVAKHLGGTATYSIDGNKLNIRVYSQVLLAVLHQYIGGKNAKTKHLNNICWSMPNSWLKELITGYFDGDGHYDSNNDRIRIGFTRNYDLERDLRVLASRLNAELTLNCTFSKIGDKTYPSFRGEWRWSKSDHWNCKKKSEIVEIRKSRARHFYDISVDSDDHLFSLASGVLTHNCKPNPMPESVTDRCTKSHEYIFLLSKSPKYYFDYEAIQEEANYDGRKDTMMKGSPKYDTDVFGQSPHTMASKGHERWQTKIRFGGKKYGGNEDNHFQTYSGNAWTPKTKNCQDKGQTPNSFHLNREKGGKDEVYYVRNKRDVWKINTKPFKEAHFAVFPEELIAPCILAGSREGGVVLDPFFGAGTTGVVCKKLSRKYVGCELNPEYIKIAEKRLYNLGESLFDL